MKRIYLFLSIFLFLCYSSLANAVASVGMYHVSANVSSAQMQSSEVAWPAAVAKVGAAVVATVGAAYAVGYALGQFAYNVSNGGEQIQFAYEIDSTGLNTDFSRFDIL